MEETFNVDQKLLNALDADTRRQIIKKLSDRQMTASELSRALNKHVTTVSEHLEVLQKNNLVQRLERPGHKWIYYKLTHDGTKLLKPTSYHWVFVLSISVLTIAFLGLGYTVFYQPASYQSQQAEQMPQIEIGKATESRDTTPSSQVETTGIRADAIILIVIGILIILMITVFLFYIKSRPKI